MRRHMYVVDNQLPISWESARDTLARLLVGTGFDAGAPLTRGECAEWELPCKLTSCRYHLANPVHGRKPMPGRNAPVCALDAAEVGERTLDEIGAWMGVTDTTVQNLQDSATRKLGSGKTRASVKLKEIHEHDWPVLESATEPEDSSGLSQIFDSRAGQKRKRRAPDPADVQADSDEAASKSSEAAE